MSGRLLRKAAPLALMGLVSLGSTRALAAGPGPAPSSMAATVGSEAESEEEQIIRAAPARNLGAALNLTLGTIPAGKSVTVKIRTAVTSIPGGTTQLSAQGTISGANFGDVLTDDPAVGGGTDPTVTPADAPATDTCSYTVTHTSAAFGLGGTGTVQVIAPSGCAWTAASNAEWLSVSPTAGSGNRTVSYTVAENPTDSSRTGTITIAGVTFTVSQAAAGVSSITIITALPDAEGAARESRYGD